jgi:hypothetical protein
VALVIFVAFVVEDVINREAWTPARDGLEYVESPTHPGDPSDPCVAKHQRTSSRLTR